MPLTRLRVVWGWLETMDIFSPQTWLIKVDFPVEGKVPKTALVSGFSPSLVSLFMEEGEIIPLAVVKRVINNPRYDRINKD